MASVAHTAAHGPTFLSQGDTIVLQIDDLQPVPNDGITVHNCRDTAYSNTHTRTDGWTDHQQWR